MLKTICELSHLYGGNPEFVLAGGGNTSCKDEKFLYVKPSGVRLANIKESDFVKMDRAAIRKCFELGEFESVAAREEAVKNMMAAAVCPGNYGRPSVEAPLHELLEQKFIVHLHPAKVNGATCGENGEEELKRIFPEALWIGYVDPGFTLAKKVFDEVEAYKKSRGKAPRILFLQNHGVFVGGNSADEVKEIYQLIMSALQSFYVSKGVDTVVDETPADAAAPEIAGYDKHDYFPTARGPLTPDHIVYAKSFSLIADVVTPEVMKNFETLRGYAPMVIEIPGKAVYTVSGNANAYTLAKDASLVQKLAGAFGGAHYICDRDREFIENWEVESYRRKMAQN